VVGRAIERDRRGRYSRRVAASLGGVDLLEQLFVECDVDSLDAPLGGPQGHEDRRRLLIGREIFEETG
jgi:hypothetical protein